MKRFHTIQFSISINFCLQSVKCQKIVLYQTIQFSLSIHFKCQNSPISNQLIKSTQFSSIWPIDRLLSGATTPDQIGPEGDGNEGVLRIPQSSIFTRASLSDSLVSYPRHSLRGRDLLFCRGTVGVFYSSSRLCN